jgi:PE family/Nuclease-related domain
MSLLTVTPELLFTAVTSVEQIGTSLAVANAAAAAQTTAIMAAAGDEVSLAIAAYFSEHGQDFQALTAKADAFHQQFEQALKGGGNSYVASEAANASPLQSAPVQSVLSAPAQTLSTRPLIGSWVDAMVPRAGGAGGPSVGAGGPAGMLVPAAAAGGRVGGGGPDETSARRSFGAPGVPPVAAARDTAAASREATRAPEPQHSDRAGHGVDGPMTITRLDSPGPANGAERAVWQALVEQLLPNDLVIVGQRVTDHLKDHEIDFTVAIEGAGIACVEVKGGEVWHDGTSWWQRRGKKDVRIEPVRQAREACYALRNFVERDPRWTRGRLRWDHIVVLPNTDVPNDFALPECPRWKVIDRTQLRTLAPRLRHVLVNQELERPLLDKAGMHQLQTALGGRGFPRPKKVAHALKDEDAVA